MIENEEIVMLSDVLKLYLALLYFRRSKVDVLYVQYSPNASKTLFTSDKKRDQIIQNLIQSTVLKGAGPSRGQLLISDSQQSGLRGSTPRRRSRHRASNSGNELARDLGTGGYVDTSPSPFSSSSLCRNNVEIGVLIWNFDAGDVENSGVP